MEVGFDARGGWVARVVDRWQGVVLFD